MPTCVLLNTLMRTKTPILNCSILSQYAVSDSVEAPTTRPSLTSRSIRSRAAP